MKNKILTITMVAAMAFAIGSCREVSDDVVSYGQKDYCNFYGTDTSFVCQFKAVWTALNCNYALWDYEEKQGLDWDKVYDKYLPKMRELDDRDPEQNPVTDEELQNLYDEILAPLHDGHICLEIMNLHTGNYTYNYPSYARNQTERQDLHKTQMPQLGYYRTFDAGENMITEYDTVRVRPSYYSKTEIDKALTIIDQHIAKYEKLESRSDLEEYFLNAYRSARDTLASFNLSSYDDLEFYNNTLTKKYEYLGITMNTFDIDMSYWIDIKYAVFDNDIAYFNLSSFNIRPYLYGWVSGTPCSDTLSARVIEVVSKWIYGVQELHKSGKLKGVIIDLRDNGGGFNTDYEFVLGSLLPEGGHTIAYNRFKTGVGRYDYSPLVPLVMATLSDEHEIITEPVVLLANGNSISMAEITCLGAKQLDNACVIGTQTWGALSSLTIEPEYYSDTYAGCVGIGDETPFYGYIPCCVTITKQQEILEGVGIIPDIEVQLDENLLNTTGRDTQLERALQYIRTGN